MGEDWAEYFSYGAVGIVVMAAKRRIVLKIRNAVGANRDAQENFVARLDQLLHDFGGSYDLIIDYTNFEPPQEIDPEEKTLFFSLLSAMRAVGVTRYHRVVPARLDGFTAPLFAAATEIGVPSVNVRTLEEAHARLDAENA